MPSFARRFAAASVPSPPIAMMPSMRWPYSVFAMFSAPPRGPS